MAIYFWFPDLGYDIHQTVLALKHPEVVMVRKHPMLRHIRIHFSNKFFCLPIFFCPLLRR